MLISDKQQEANRQNAQHSTGPKTPEGKAAVRLNALTYGLRARDLLLPGDDPEEYKKLWADLEADWQPQNRTERLHLEQMSTSQWLLARIANRERRVYEAGFRPSDEFSLLRDLAALRARLERSYTTSMHELKQLKKNRQARPSPPIQTAQAAQPAQAPVQKPAEPHVPPPDYVMSEGAENHPVFCSPVAPDTR
jgi:hypothetical protein